MDNLWAYWTHWKICLLEEWWSGKNCRGALLHICMIWLFHPIAKSKFCIVAFPRDLQHPYSVSWFIRSTYLAKKTTSEHHPCRIMWSHSRPALQAQCSGIPYHEGCRVFEDQASRQVSENFPECTFPFCFILWSQQLINILLGWSLSSLRICCRIQH